jgi:hypothetical protein
MIYDGHAYCIMDLNGDGGFEDPSQFRRHLQVAMARRLSRPTRFRGVWRKSDGAANDSSTLADPDLSWSPDAAGDVGFTPGARGTVEWSSGGVDYVKQR